MTAASLTFMARNGTEAVLRPQSMKNTFLFALIGMFALVVIAYASNPRVTTTAPAPMPADTVLDLYLSRLTWAYECTGACAKAEKNGEPYRRIDSNGLYSYGCLQFQRATYIAMADKYDIDPWANGGIYDCDNQWKIAKAMFEDNPTAAAQHWYTSIYTRGLGLPIKAQ